MHILYLLLLFVLQAREQLRTMNLVRRLGPYQSPCNLINKFISNQCAKYGGVGLLRPHPQGQQARQMQRKTLRVYGDVRSSFHIVTT